MSYRIFINQLFFKFFLLIFLVGLCGCQTDTKWTNEPTRWEKFKSIFAFTDSKDIKNPKRAPFTLHLEDYENIFSAVNGIDKEYYDSLLVAGGGEILWDSPDNLVLKTRNSKKRYLDKNYKVFGWHPFWMEGAYKNYDYSLLNYVSWFSYDIDPISGSYSNPSVIEKLKTEGPELIELAHAQDCKVLLTLTNHGTEKTQRFLKNAVNQENQLLDSVLNLVTTLKLDGLDLNFERVAKGQGYKMTQFVKNISDKLKSLNPDYTMSLTIPKLNKGQYKDIQSLNKYVDMFVLTGYDFHTAGSARDGPIAPLRGNEYSSLSIESIVNDYLEEGVEAKKLILALPYYGGVWSSKNEQSQSKNRSFKRHLTYRALMSTYGAKAQPQYVRDVESAYFLNQIDSSNFEKIWFDDSITLQTKFAWAKEQKLGGVGIWALGYDNGRDEMWRLLDQTFALDSPEEITIETGHGFNVMRWLLGYEVPIIIAFLFFTVFVGLGFLVSLFDWRVRNYLFANKSSRLLFILSTFGFIIVTYMTILFFQQKSIYSSNTVVLFAGLIMGALLTFIFTQLYRWHRNRLP